MVKKWETVDLIETNIYDVIYVSAYVWTSKCVETYIYIYTIIYIYIFIIYIHSYVDIYFYVYILHDTSWRIKDFHHVFCQADPLPKAGPVGKCQG